jgi:hypothetical protein
MYLLFAWIRWPFSQAPSTRDVGVTKASGAGGLAVICILAVIAFSSRIG